MMFIYVHCFSIVFFLTDSHLNNSAGKFRAADAARFISPCWLKLPMENLVKNDPKEMMMIQKGLSVYFPEGEKNTKKKHQPAMVARVLAWLNRNLAV